MCFFNMNNQKEILRAASFVLGKEITSITQLTDEQLLFFSALDKKSLNKCFIVQGVLDGMPYRQVGQKYGISKDAVKLCFENN